MEEEVLAQISNGYIRSPEILHPETQDFFDLYNITIKCLIPALTSSTLQEKFTYLLSSSSRSKSPIVFSLISWMQPVLSV